MTTIEQKIEEITKKRRKIKDLEKDIELHIKEITDKIAKHLTNKKYGVSHNKFEDRIEIFARDELPLWGINNMIDDLGITKERVTIGGNEEKENIISIEIGDSIVQTEI